MSIFDPVWAVDGETYVPTEAEIRSGFQCGAANPYLFNYLFQSIEATINSLDVSGLVPLSREINTGLGLTGGGNLSQNRTINVAFVDFETSTTIANDDWVFIYDQSEGGYRKISRANFVAGLGGEGGAIVGAENIGDGDGEFFAAVDGGTTLQFRTLDVGAGLDILTDGNTVTVSFAALPSELTVE